MVCRKIILRTDLKIIVQRHGLVRNPKQIRPHIIKGISDIRKQHRLFRIEKREKRHCQHIIRPHTDKHLLRFYAIPFRQRADQLRRSRIRILSQPVRRQMFQRLLHSRRRWIRVFIGIQFDHRFFPWLFPRNIRYHFSDICFPAFHRFPPYQPLFFHVEG